VKPELNKKNDDEEEAKATFEKIIIGWPNILTYIQKQNEKFVLLVSPIQN
jgi:hypothetical protein